LNRAYYIPGLVVLALGFAAFVIDFIQYHPFSSVPAADFILMGGLILSGLITLAAGKASLFAGGLLMLATWLVWNYAPVPQFYGEGDMFYRITLPILAVLFLLAGVFAALANRKKRKRK
jgi:hypothetical protein